MESKCGSCNLCVKSCPGKAIYGREFNENEPDELRIDSFKCKELIENKKRNGVYLLSDVVVGCV